MNKPNCFTWASARKLLGLAALTAIIGLTGCQTTFTNLTTNKRDWDFVQSVGGMTLGKVRPAGDGSWYLPVNCNVSGLKTFSTTPSAVYENIACRDVLEKTEGNNILLTVRTCVQSPEYQDSAASGVNLGRLPPGNYSVFYANRDGSRWQIGEITIPQSPQS